MELKKCDILTSGHVKFETEGEETVTICSIALQSMFNVMRPLSNWEFARDNKK